VVAELPHLGRKRAARSWVNCSSAAREAVPLLSRACATACLLLWRRRDGRMVGAVLSYAVLASEPILAIAPDAGSLIWWPARATASHSGRARREPPHARRRDRVVAPRRYFVKGDLSLTSIAGSGRRMGRTWLRLAEEAEAKQSN
jgi:hypothetical protein